MEKKVKAERQTKGLEASQATNLSGEPRYLLLRDDIATTAFWYQSEPHAQFPTLPGLEGLEVVEKSY